MSIELLALQMELDYADRLRRYNHDVEMLELQRKKFYEENPDFQIKTMYMNVCAPPRKIEIKIVR